METHFELLQYFGRTVRVGAGAVGTGAASCRTATPVSVPTLKVMRLFLQLYGSPAMVSIVGIVYT
jgi:hypothetical protein